MTTTEKPAASVLDRWIDLLHRIGEAAGRELMLEADDMGFELRADGAREAFGRLVIGIYTDGVFPTVTDAVRVVEVEPVTIDECDHRGLLAAGRMLSSLAATGGQGDAIAGAFRTGARGALERDLGNGDEAERLFTAARRSMNPAT